MSPDFRRGFPQVSQWLMQDQRERSDPMRYDDPIGDGPDAAPWINIHCAVAPRRCRAGGNSSWHEIARGMPQIGRTRRRLWRLSAHPGCGFMHFAKLIAPNFHRSTWLLCDPGRCMPKSFAQIPFGLPPISLQFVGERTADRCVAVPQSPQRSSASSEPSKRSHSWLRSMLSTPPSSFAWKTKLPGAGSPLTRLPALGQSHKHTKNLGTSH